MSMNTLTLHIEYLLTVHDCVVIPDFGGIVLRHKEAEFSKNHQLCAPYKVAGFNPSLNHNDGLLANSYMRTKKISFNEAMILIESEVKELKALLVQGEIIELGSVGSFQMDEDSAIQFTPALKSAFDLDLFGFEELQLFPLIAAPKEELVEFVHDRSEENPDVIMVPLNLRVLRRVGSIAAIVIGMLMVAQPLEDSSIPDNYASLISSDLITRAITPNAILSSNEDVISDEFISEEPIEADEIIEEINTEKEIVEVASQMEVKEPEAVETPEIKRSVPPKRYYIIVGSFPTKQQADSRIKVLAKKGYPGIDVIKKGDKYRLYINSFLDKKDANRYLETFREDNPILSDAWLLAHSS